MNSGCCHREVRLVQQLTISVIFLQGQSGEGEVIVKRVVIIQKKEVRRFVAVADLGRIFCVCVLALSLTLSVCYYSLIVTRVGLAFSS